jgi:anti-sigma factor RsiW
MNCDDCQDGLIDFAHHELAGEARTRIAEHLTHCAECALEYCRLQADLHGIVIAHDDDAPGDHVRAALRARVAAAITPPWWRRLAAPLRRPIPMYGAVLAAAVPLAVWIATALGRPEPRPTPPASSPPTITHYDATAMPNVHREVL